MSVLESMSFPKDQPSSLEAFPELLTVLKEVGISEQGLLWTFGRVLEKSVAVGKENLQLTGLDLVIEDSRVEPSQITQERLLISLAQVVGKLNDLESDICEAAMKDFHGIVKVVRDHWGNYIDVTFRENNGGFVIVLSIDGKSLRKDNSEVKGKKREQTLVAMLQGEFGLAFDVGMDLYVVCNNCGTTYSIRGMKALLCPQCGSNSYKPKNEPKNPVEGEMPRMGGIVRASRTAFLPQEPEEDENDDMTLLEVFTRSKSNENGGGLVG